MRKGLIYLALYSLFYFCFGTLAAAQQNLPHLVPMPRSDQCAQEIRKCFLVSTQGADRCFVASANSTACHNQKVAQLALQRAAMSLGDVPDMEAAPELSPFSRGCLENFDKQFSQALLEGTVDKNLFRLEGLLASCRLKSPEEFVLE